MPYVVQDGSRLMVAYAPHTLVTFGGVLNTGAATPEIWQSGVRVTDVVGGGPLADHDAYLAGIKDPLGTWFEVTGSAGFPATATLNWIKANPINAAGKYADDTTHLYDYPTPVAGGGVAPFFSPVPDILCLAISWTTAKARGKSHAGRIYLPNYSMPVVTPGSMRAQGGLNALWRDRGLALLALLANSNVHAVPIIASSAGPTAQITGVRVGDVIDVQRRRKDALKESYVSGIFAPA